MYKEIWFIRPGHASTLTPKAGIAQLCKTSREVTNTRIFVCTGKYTILSTSNKRNPPFGKFSSVNI